MIAVAEVGIYSGVVQSFKDTVECHFSFAVVGRRPQLFGRFEMQPGYVP